MSKISLEPSIIQRLAQCERLFVGLSGGLDSTVLLHLLSTFPVLHSKLHAIHVHHGLSPHAAQWEAWCQAYCAQLSLPCVVKKVTCKQTETSARIARYQAFRQVVGVQDGLVLAHHEDDQAETVLLNACRGSGVDGLCGMWPARFSGELNIMRPLLFYPRARIKQHAKSHHLTWIDDESNENQSYARNYLRHGILPDLQKKWPKVTKQFAGVACQAQKAASNLLDLAYIDYPPLKRGTTSLDLCQLPLTEARVENVIWCWLKQHSVTPLNQSMLERVMVSLVRRPKATGLSVMFKHHAVRHYRKTLYLTPLVSTSGSPVIASGSSVIASVSEAIQQRSVVQGQLLDCFANARNDGNVARTDGAFAWVWTHFPQDFILPEGRGCLQAVPGSEGAAWPDHATVEIKLREGGEQFFWRQQTKSLKKLWQAWGVPAWQRSQVPLIYVNGELAVVVGYAISDRFYSKGGKGWTLRLTSSSMT